MLLAHFIYLFRFSHRNTSPTILWGVTLLAASLLMIWTLRSKIVKQIQIDYESKEITVIYSTLLTSFKKVSIPFGSLGFQLTKHSSLHNPKKWVLEIFDDHKKIFVLETNRDGFQQQCIEDLTSHLTKLKQT